MTKKSIVSGDVFQTKNFGECVVLEYKDCNNVTVQFTNTGYITTVQASNLRDGRIRDPFSPSVFGVGYIGNTKVIDSNGVTKRSYRLWCNMLGRCYNGKRPTYKDCSVSDPWKCFATFERDIKQLEGYSMWCDPSNYYSIDKDTRIKGNKVYGIATCVFIPISDNVRDGQLRRYEN